MDPAVDSGSNVLAPGEEHGPGRRTDGATRIEVGEPDAFFCQAVDRRGLDRTSVTTDILKAEIVGEENQDIRSVGFSLRESGAGEKQ